MRPRLLISRLLLLAVYAGIFTLAWPWVGELYGRAFRASATELCRSLTTRWEVELTPLPNPRTTADSELRLYNRKVNQGAGQDISVHYIGYAPTAFLVALILATPLPWKRRLAALVWGFLWMHVWIALCVLVLVVYGYSRGNSMAIFDVSPWVRMSLSFLRDIMVKAPVMKYTVPAVIWILVTFRRSDWARFAGAFSTDETPHNVGDDSTPRRKSRST